MCKMNPSILPKSESSYFPKEREVRTSKKPKRSLWNFGNVPYLHLDHGYSNMDMYTK